MENFYKVVFIFSMKCGSYVVNYSLNAKRVASGRDKALDLNRPEQTLLHEGDNVVFLF